MRADKVQSLCKTLEQQCHNNARTNLLLVSTHLRVRLGQHDIWDSMHKDRDEGTYVRNTRIL